MAKDVKPVYRVLVGCNFPPNDTRAEPGDVLSELPKPVAEELLAAGAIEPVKEGAQ